MVLYLYSFALKRAPNLHTWGPAWKTVSVSSGLLQFIERRNRSWRHIGTNSWNEWEIFSTQRTTHLVLLWINFHKLCRHNGCPEVHPQTHWEKREIKGLVLPQTDSQPFIVSFYSCRHLYSLNEGIKPCRLLHLLLQKRMTKNHPLSCKEFVFFLLLLARQDLDSQNASNGTRDTQDRPKTTQMRQTTWTHFPFVFRKERNDDFCCKRLSVKKSRGFAYFSDDPFCPSGWNRNNDSRKGIPCLRDLSSFPQDKLFYPQEKIFTLRPKTTTPRIRTPQKKWKNAASHLCSCSEKEKSKPHCLCADWLLKVVLSMGGFLPHISSKAWLSNRVSLHRWASSTTG